MIKLSRHVFKYAARVKRVKHVRKPPDNIMRKICILFLPIVLLLGLCWLAFRSQDPSLHPPALSRHEFDQTLGMKELSKSFVLHRSLDRKIRHTARQLIEKRKSEWSLTSPSSIPRIIHQVWLSVDPLPDDLARASRLVQQQHPGFRYILWRYSDVHKILHDLLGPSYTALPISLLRDVAAAAILWEHGGVVVDLEAECVHPITALLSLGDCLIGFEPPLPSPKWKRRLFLSSAVIAVRPSHPIIQSYLAEMIRRIQISENNEKIDAQWVTQDALTSVLAKIGLKQGKPLLLGPSYFCPVNPNHIHHLQRVLNKEVHRNWLQKVFRTLHIASVPPYSDVSRETIFVHMTGGRMSKQFS